MENLKKAMIIRNGNVVGAVGDKNFSTAPIGTVLAYAGNEAPRGYLLADGASYPTADYPELYAVIGNTYGGDSTNFNVPNLVDKFIQGSTASGTEKEAGLPNIEGKWIADSIYAPYFEGTMTGAFSTEDNGQGVRRWGSNDGNGRNTFLFDASLSNPIYGNSDTVQPPALTMVYIIKAFHTNEGVDSGVSDDVVEYVDNKFSSVDIKTTVTIPTGQYLKIELGENKLSTVLLSMKTTIGTGYTTFLISNYGIGTDARCKVQQLQGEKKFAKYIDGCNLYITPSMTDQVWYASAISVQGVNPVLSASETYSGTEITTNSVPKEIVDGLIKDTSSTTSTYSSAKIDEKYGAYTFGTADATQWLKLTLGNSSKFQPITITDQYGGKVEITGMADDGTYKSVKLVRYSYGDWTTYSATDYTTTSQGDANYKIRRLYYYPTNGCYYLEIRQWCTIKVSGTTTKPEMVTSLPTETSAMTSIPESRFASKSDLATQTANRQVKTFDNTGTSTEKWYKICSALTTGIGCNIKLTASRADSTATVQYFSALFRDSRYRYTSSYISRERNVYESALIAEYSAYIIADANNDIWVYVPSYGKAIIEIDTRAVTIDGTAGTPVEDYVYSSFEHQYDGKIVDTETNSVSTWSSSKIASEINPAIDISKVFSGGALNISTLCGTYGNGRYVIVGQGTAGNGSATIDIWTLASNAISYIVNVTYSNKTSNTFIGLTYENPTVNFETNYLSACNHIAKVCTLA